MDLTPKFTNPLEQLLATALAHATPKATPRKRTEPDRHGEFDRSAYTNPDNWQRTAGVTLMHEGTNTLLGNFSEYRNLIDKGARKLIREHEPIGIDRTELVNGSLWTRDIEEPIPSPERLYEHVEVTVDVLLAEMGFVGQGVKVLVTLVQGDLLQRATLSLDTEFHSLDGEQILILPRKLNVLPAMSFDSKLALRAELGL